MSLFVICITVVTLLSTFVAASLPTGWALESVCVSDVKDSRLLTTKAIDTSSLTVYGCLAQCATLKLKYAGLQHGTQVRRNPHLNGTLTY